MFSHWSHLNEPFSRALESEAATKGADFLFKNSSFLFWFLLLAEGVSFLTSFTTVLSVSAFLDSRMVISLLVFKEKTEVGSNGEGEVDGLPHAGQRLAKFQALFHKGRIVSSLWRRRHF